MAKDDFCVGVLVWNFVVQLFVNSNVSFTILLQTRTKDGYVLGLQRVTSHSVAVHKGAPPVLLIHGLFMVIVWLASAAWFLVNIWMECEYMEIICAGSNCWLLKSVFVLIMFPSIVWNWLSNAFLGGWKVHWYIYLLVQEAVGSVIVSVVLLQYYGVLVTRLQRAFRFYFWITAQW